MAAMPAVRSAEHQHPAGETCPYCEQSIPNDRAQEIRARYALKQRQEEAAMKVRLDQQLADARAQFETEKKGLKEENAAALQKAAADALARETAAHEQGKQAAAAEAQQKLETLQAAQAASDAKLQELQQQKADVDKQLATAKSEQNAIVAARSAEIRAAYEKNKTDELNARDAKHAEAAQKLLEQIKVMERRLSAEEGEGADIKLLDQLKQKFPKDQIKPIKKSTGADISHVVIHNNKSCGTILYDSRNRNIWQTNFAATLKQDLVAAKAAHAILTTAKFPNGAQHIHLCEGVIAARLPRVAVLAEILRDEIIRNHAQRVSQQDRALKTTKLYDFIASDGFDSMLESLADNDEKLLRLDEDEQKTHKKVWERRRTLTTNSQKLHGKLRVDIDRIVGTAETE